MRHQWVTFEKNHISIRACARCGEVLLPMNEHSECRPVSMTENIFFKKGYHISSHEKTQKVA